MGDDRRQVHETDGILKPTIRRVYIGADDWDALIDMAARGFRSPTQQVSKLIHDAKQKESNDGNNA